MKTAITEMFGIDVPILAFSHCRDVVAAVSKAGGMGVLGAVALFADEVNRTHVCGKKRVAENGSS